MLLWIALLNIGCRMDQYFGSSCQTSWFFEHNYSTVLQKVIDHSRISTTQKVKFLKRFLKKTSELVRFTKEILNRKPYVFSSEDWQSTVTGEFSASFIHPLFPKLSHSEVDITRKALLLNSFAKLILYLTRFYGVLISKENLKRWIQHAHYISPSIIWQQTTASLNNGIP